MTDGIMLTVQIQQVKSGTPSRTKLPFTTIHAADIHEALEKLVKQLSVVDLPEEPPRCPNCATLVCGQCQLRRLQQVPLPTFAQVVQAQRPSGLSGLFGGLF